MNTHTAKSPQTVTHHDLGPLFRKALCIVNGRFTRTLKAAQRVSPPCRQQSPGFLARGTGFLEDHFFSQTRVGGGFSLIQELCIYHALTIIASAPLRITRREIPEAGTPAAKRENLLLPREGGLAHSQSSLCSACVCTAKLHT